MEKSQRYSIISFTSMSIQLDESIQSNFSFSKLSNIVYHDDVRLERLMSISSYLRDIGSPTEPDIELMKKNIGIYMA